MKSFIYGFLVLVGIAIGVIISNISSDPPPQIIRAAVYEPYPDMHLIDSFVGPYNEFFDTVSGDHIMIICTHEDDHP